MPNTVYTFSFSPPARLAWLTAKIYNVPTEIVQVNLAKGEQLELDFIKMNPRHEVPVFDHEGEFITQSRTIAKYFHENFNQDLEGNDHWYPKDPEERAKVDEWLNFSDKRHMSICKPALGYAISKFVMPWRANYGIIMSILGNKLKKDKSALAEMKTNLSDAEEILSHRKIQNVQDLNLGDLAIFFETTLPFFVLPEINYEDYPAFDNLYKIIQQIPEFQEIDEKFREFLLPLEKNERSPSIFTYFKEVWTTIKLGCYIKWNGISMDENS